MMAADSAVKALKAIVEGDVTAIRALAQHPQDSILAARRQVGKLVLTRGAAARVIDELASGSASPESAQAWASFVRRGYLAGQGDGAVQPVDIEFDPLREADVADVVGRLDELGDAIDGDIGASELEQLRRRLDDH